MHDLTSLVAEWPDPSEAAIGVTTPSATIGRGGDTSRVSRIASVSKVFVGLTALVAIEEGTLDLDEPAGRPGATVRHLLAHAAGYDFDTDRIIADVGSRRIYSNTGIEVFADHLVDRSGMSFAEYQHEAVIAPLAMVSTDLRGSPAYDMYSCVDDLLLLGRELLVPTLISPATLAEATRPQFGGLGGVIPGLGRFHSNPWGLGMEIRGTKQPHWTGTTNSPETFGHFGGSGTFFWVDPVAQLACMAISGTEYGAWALDVWLTASDTVLAMVGRD